MLRTVFVILSAFFLSAFFIAGDCIPEDDSRSVMIAVLRDKPRDLENNQFLIEFTPYYYKYKSDTSDWYAPYLLLRADIGPDWEISIGSDFFAYQRPDYGFSDIYLGAKWKFFSNDDFAIAVTGYLDLPTGNKVFREPGIEPTLAFLASHKIGDFEFGGSIGSTYASDSRGEPYYFDIEMTLELDYIFNKNNSFGVFSYGYTPDQRNDGSSCITGGATYIHTVNNLYAVGITLMKGFSGRGMDWSCMFSHSFTF